MASRADNRALFLRALGDRTRLRLMELLAQTPGLAVNQLVGLLGVRQPAASRHLAYLRRHGLVIVKADGRRKLYSVAPATGALEAAVLTTLAKPSSTRSRPRRRSTER